MGLTISSTVVEQSIEILDKRKGKIVAFTGAGISAESGMPTYRDPGGLWTIYNQKKVSHISGFLRRPLSCWRFEVELYRVLKDCTFNAAHRALADLEKAGWLLGVITQNVDGLHSAAGSATVVELHGNETRAVCMNESCRKKVPVQHIFKENGWIDERGSVIDSALPDDSWIRIMEDDDGFDEDLPNETAMQMSGVYDDVPKCSTCGCLLKPDAVYFGEGLDEKVLLRAQRLVSTASCMLIVGSNCSVAPASTLPSKVKQAGGKLLEVNPRTSMISDTVDIRIEGLAADVLPKLAHGVLGRRQSLKRKFLG